MLTAALSTQSSARVTTAIRTAADSAGVDFNYLYNQARLESGFNPEIRARTSSATGLFQFLDQSWLGVVRQHGSQHGMGWAASAIRVDRNGRYSVADPQLARTIMDLRRQPEAASTMAAAFAADNRAYLSNRLDRPIESVDLYVAHFLGPNGAGRFLEAHAANPDAAAAPAFGREARANRSIFFDRSGAARSYDGIRRLFAERLAAGTPPPPSADYVASPPAAAPATFAPPSPNELTFATDTSSGPGSSASPFMPAMASPRAAPAHNPFGLTGQLHPLSPEFARITYLSLALIDVA